MSVIGKERNFGCIVRIAKFSMVRTADIVEIPSEKESPIRPTWVEEEFMSIPIRSSSIPRVKQKA